MGSLINERRLDVHEKTPLRKQFMALTSLSDVATVSHFNGSHVVVLGRFISLSLTKRWRN
jgi:hypothetical protein